MQTVVLKLFAGQVTGRTKRRLYAYPFGEHKKGLTILPAGAKIRTLVVMCSQHRVYKQIINLLATNHSLWPRIFLKKYILLFAILFWTSGCTLA